MCFGRRGWRFWLFDIVSCLTLEMERDAGDSLFVHTLIGWLLLPAIVVFRSFHRMLT
jgi:thiosulfate reductase cytochrome b subunit